MEAASLSAPRCLHWVLRDEHSTYDDHPILHVSKWLFSRIIRPHGPITNKMRSSGFIQQKGPVIRSWGLTEGAGSKTTVQSADLSNAYPGCNCLRTLIIVLGQGKKSHA